MNSYRGGSRGGDNARQSTETKQSDEGSGTSIKLTNKKKAKVSSCDREHMTLTNETSA